MKKSELRKMIREELKNSLREATSQESVSELLDILSSMTPHMDNISDEMYFNTVKDLYTKLYNELKKHE